MYSVHVFLTLGTSCQAIGSCIPPLPIQKLGKSRYYYNSNNFSHVFIKRIFTVYKVLNYLFELCLKGFLGCWASWSGHSHPTLSHTYVWRWRGAAQTTVLYHSPFLRHMPEPWVPLMSICRCIYSTSLFRSSFIYLLRLN